MNIIIEGPNAVGKSSLINTILMDNYFSNYTVEHLTNINPNDPGFYRALLNQNKLILDRSYISEYVYATIYNRVPKFSLDDIKSFSNEIKKSTKFIFCDADYDVIITNLLKRNEPVDIEFIAKEKEYFYKCIEALVSIGIPVVTKKLHLNNIVYSNEFSTDNVLTYLKTELKYQGGCI